MGTMNVREAASLWGLSERRVTVLCKEGRIEGAVKKGHAWTIPADARKPGDNRTGSKSSKKKSLPIGISEFRKAVSKFYYIDKTLLIRDLIDEGAAVSLFTRPRRFGKTLNMDMLREYFEISSEDTSKYFKDKLIWECGEEYRQEQGKYPVIFLTFKDVKFQTWDETLENIRRSFHAFAQRVPAEGVLIINQEIENLSELTDGLSCNVETFGLADGADWQARNITHEADGRNAFDVYYKGERFGRIDLQVPGEHNIMNALASIASAAFLGISHADCQKGLGHFTGTERRFQKKGEKNGVLVIDDYAHHPTEIRAALAAAKKVQHNKTWCVFQPHTYSRTKFLFDEFGEAFALADEIIVADIFAAREAFDETISSKMLAERIAQTGKDAKYLGDFDAIRTYLEANCKSGDLLLTVGAGDVFKIGEDFLKP